MCLNKSTEFQNQEFDPFISENVLGLNDQSDPGVNLFDGINLIKTNYFSIDGVIKELKFSRQNSFSISHLNIKHC